MKKRNPTVVLENKSMVNRIKNALAMLSSNLKSNYCINKGDNDDYKILLPYYFEVTNPLESPDATDYYEYKDIVVKLKSNYGIFTENSFEFNQDIISKNYIYQLDYNNFSFPEINNSLETSSIPSTMPLDQQLANGSYSKYLVHRITNLDEEVKQLYSSYGSGKIEFDSYNDSLTNKGEFKLQSPSYITELLVSSISGYELWEFKLTDEYNETVKFAIGLFDSTDQSRSLISLIL
ncbi:MAG: hypothetical protein EIB84_02605 [Spiroplasma poulsonii]|nr:hypothetical protein [Spiroplasma poulsonii]